MVSSARLASLPAPEADLLHAVTDGPPTVRVAVFSSPGTRPDLCTTPAPVGDRKLSPAFLTALAEGDPDAPAVGVNRFPVPGDLFLGFRLVEELGRGSFARVFLAHQEALAGRPVALKVTLRPTREAERLARLQHTNVVPVYSVHDANPAQIICMPYLGRRTIADLIRAYRAHHSTRGLGGRRTTRAVRPSRTTAVAEGSSKSAPRSHPTDPTNPPEPAAPAAADQSLIGDPLAVVRVLARLADGLAHAHDRGILHLDLKPANVLLTDDGEPMLLDFNLSFDAADRERGLVGGTVPYMAIEQLIDLKSRGKGKIDARTDLYSLGVMAYEMLTGTVPFPASGPNDVDVLVADRRAGCPSVRALNPLVTPAVEAVVHKLLAPEPQDRYQTAAALRTDLQRHLDNLPLESAREPSVRERVRKWRRRNPGVPARLLAAAAFGLLVGLAGAGYMRAEGNARAAAGERVRATRTGLDRLRIDLIVPGDAAARSRAVARAEEVLAAYGLPGDAGWAGRGDAARLAPADRAALGGDLGELALLVAEAKWRDAESRPNPARLDGASAALKYNRAALACFAPDAVPEFLHRRAADLAAEAGEPPIDVPPAAPGRKPSARERFLEAAAAVSAARYTAAAPLLDRVVAEQPGNAAAQFCLAYCRQQQGQYTRAVERYDVAQVLMPADPLPAYQRGVCFATVRRPRDAEAEFTRALELDPEFARAYRDRALARYRLGGRERLSEAEADLTAALDRGSPALQIHLLRAEVRKQLGDAAGEAADRKAAEEGVPRTDSDYIVRGWASMRRKEAGPALADYEEALSLNPRSLTALQNQAHVLADLMNDLPAALEVATKATQLYPEFAPARSGRALVLARLGDRDAAVREVEAALRLSDDPEVVYQAACVYALGSKDRPGDARRAMDLIGKAFRVGFEDVRKFRADADLAALREHHEFAALERSIVNLYAR